ncbi:hypothetical protein [Streptococcus sp. DD13]|uniref:hypothetical protein n=1 Tax=Streptococcus sp. DD13 TaxID=1777881 RepID=UPI003FA79AAC
MNGETSLRQRAISVPERVQKTNSTPTFSPSEPEEYVEEEPTSSLEPAHSYTAYDESVETENHHERERMTDRIRDYFGKWFE